LSHIIFFSISKKSVIFLSELELIPEKFLWQKNSIFHCAVLMCTGNFLHHNAVHSETFYFLIDKKIYGNNLIVVLHKKNS